MISLRSIARRIGVVMLLAGLSPVFAQSRSLTPAQRPLVPSPSQNITLNPGDSIRVTFFDTPELTVEHTEIGMDGTVKLPLVGDLHLAGMNESEAAHVIDNAYRSGNFLVEPQSSVVILNFALNGVSITGEVVKPGNYPVTGSRTLVDIIAIAGGLTHLADTRITILRSNGTLENKIYFPLDDAVRTLRNDVNVFPGDRVVVQRSGTVYVLGDVTHAGGYLMQYDGTLTVLQAIALAGGSSRTSGEKSIFLVQRREGTYKTRRLPLRDMYKGKSPDMELSAGDVLYVPASNARNFVFNAPQILGTLAGAALYSVNR